MRFVLPILLFLGVAAGIAVFFVADTPPEAYAEQKEDIVKLLDGRTAEEAYSLFMQRYGELSVGPGHQAAHIFGELLYDREGMRGMSVCDGNFGFGCFHSFVSSAIAEHGERIIPELDVICLDAYGPQGLGCFHGIGHGVLANRGYELGDLTYALDECSGLLWNKRYGGCSDGVFMEYNLRTMEGESAQSRDYTDATRHEPCATIDDTSGVVCYFNQPAWWLVSFPDDDSQRTRIGQLCEEVRNTEERQACFRGIGYAYAPRDGFDVTMGVSTCESASNIEQDERWCREGLAWALYADPDFRHDAETACRGLSTDEENACLDGYLFTLK